jgi:glycosyltransferase involved in cell wall biosynthesis
MKACIIIPVHNEAKTIARLVKRIKELRLDVIVIDDGSTDNTAQIVQDNGAIILRNNYNQGKGASLIRGFHYVLGRDYSAVITMDGDGQHLAEDIPNFIRCAEHSGSGIFVGNRLSKAQGMPWVRILTNKFMSWILSKVAKQKIPDSQCGFRLIKREVLKKLNLKSAKYEIESEVLIRAARLGSKIEAVPIKTVYGGEKSKINPFADTLRFIRFISKELTLTQRRFPS